MQVFLTFDYELFFGSSTGSVEKCMIEPTNILLDMAEKHAVPMTFFVDIGFILRLKENCVVYPHLKSDLLAIQQQIQRMMQLRCDIQLHIHPHWEKSFYDGNKWVVNTAGSYKLSDFSSTEIHDIVYKYHAYLRQLTGKEIQAFRAGGWCIQPFQLLEKAFMELGIKFDSSVFPGGKFESEHYQFDFTQVDAFKSSYKFQNDVCVEDESGSFTEVPIASWNYSPLFYWKLYGLGRLFPAQHKMLGDGNFVPQPGRKKSVLSSYTWNHVSSDGFYSSMLTKQAKKYAVKQVDRFVIIGHPKGMTRYSLKKLEEFIAASKSSYSFVNFETCD